MHFFSTKTDPVTSHLYTTPVTFKPYTTQFKKMPKNQTVSKFSSSDMYQSNTLVGCYATGVILYLSAFFSQGLHCLNILYQVISLT